MVRLNAINVEAMTVRPNHASSTILSDLAQTQLSSYGVPTGPTTSASFVNTPAPASRPYDSTANPSSYQPPETPHDTRMPYVVPSQTSHPSGPPGYPHGNQSQPATSSTSRTNYVNSSAQNPSLVPTPSQQGYPQSGQSGPTGWAARTSGHSGQGPTYEGSGANLSYGAGPGGNYGGGQNGNYSGGQADTYGGAQGAGYGRGVPGGYGNGPGGDYGGSRGSYGSAGRGGPYGGRAQSGTYGGAHGRNGPGPGPQGYGHPPPASPAAQPPSMTVPEGLAHLPEEQKVRCGFLIF